MAVLNKSAPEADLRTALQGLGAREFEIVALSMDPHRGLAALATAQTRGVDRPVPYAIKLFDSPDWQPSSEKQRIATNRSVERKCAHCGGDRFVPVTSGPGLYEETYAPCKVCNAGANTTRYSVDGTRLETAPQ